MRIRYFMRTFRAQGITKTKVKVEFQLSSTFGIFETTTNPNKSCKSNNSGLKMYCNSTGASSSSSERSVYTPITTPTMGTDLLTVTRYDK